MTDYVQPALAGFLCITQFLASLACYSLREFSRSRLDEICTARGLPERFGDILKRHELALMAAEILSAVNAILLAVVLFQSWNLAPFTEATPLEWALWGLEWGLLLIGFGFLSVILPWVAARIGGEKFLFRFWPLVTLVQILLKPAIQVAQRIDTISHRVSGVVAPEDGDAATITEEIRTVVDEGHSEGLLKPGARTMINRVIELQNEDAASVMTPRTDMVSLNVDSTQKEAGDLMLDAGHSRVPVVGESIDDIVGILYAKDLLNQESNGESVSLRDIVREPFYVPETTSVDRLLETMQRKKVHLAIVLDEYGGVAGLVTMEDILEEIVGEIEDEYDVAEQEPIREISPGIDEVDARVHIDDLNELRRYDLPEETDYETVGGFVFSHLGRIPELGEEFTWSQLRFTVLEADKRRVVKLRIEVDESLAEAESEEQ